MKKLWSTTHNDGSISIWYFDPDTDFHWGESTDWIPWWVYYPDKGTVDYCTMLNLLDPSIICTEFKGSPDFIKTLWKIHDKYKMSGMNNGIKLGTP
jgi:hypothetical protein